MEDERPWTEAVQTAKEHYDSRRMDARDEKTAEAYSDARRAFEELHDAITADLASLNALLMEALDGMMTAVFWADGGKMRCGVCGWHDGEGHDAELVCASATEALARGRGEGA